MKKIKRKEGVAMNQNHALFFIKPLHNIEIGTQKLVNLDENSVIEVAVSGVNKEDFKKEVEAFALKLIRNYAHTTVVIDPDKMSDKTEEGVFEMEKVNVEVILKDKKLVLSGIEKDQADKIIDCFFNGAQVNFVGTNEDERKGKIEIDPQKEKPKVKIFKEEKKEVIPRPRVLPIIDSNKSLEHKPFKVLENIESIKNWKADSEKEEVPDLYQTSYECPCCGNTGKRRIPKTNKYTKCHACSTKLLVEYAIPSEFLAQDKNGNHFIARDFY